MLAVVSVDINIFEDVDGSPGALIADETVGVGDTFFLQITAREHDPGYSGLQGVAIDLAWDPGVLEEIDALFDPATLITPNLPVLVTGTLDNQAGRIQNLGGSSFSAWGVGKPIGSDGNDQYVKPHLLGFATTDDHFAWLHFRALGEADDSLLTLRQGGSAIATMPVSSLHGSQLALERQTITVTPADRVVEQSDEVSTPPWIEVTNGPSHATGTIQFTTMIGGEDGDSRSPLVRPALSDITQYIDVTNTGENPLTIFDVQVNAPDVTVSRTHTHNSEDSIIVQAGETKKFGLTYAPSTPNATDATVQSFDLADGLVILSNAANAPIVQVGLRGDSTFDADTNYDGRVDIGDLILFDKNFGLQAEDDGYAPRIDPNGDGVIDVVDLRSFAAHFHRSRTMPSLGAAPSTVLAAGEGEASGMVVTLPNACVADSDRQPIAPLASPSIIRPVPAAGVRSKTFVGPLQPHEYATQLIFTEPANDRTTRATPVHLDDELVDLLATDVNSHAGPLPP